MLKHGQWLSAINTTVTMDYQEHDLSMPSGTNMLRCATSHESDSEKLILIKNGYLSQKDKRPQKLIIQELTSYSTFLRFNHLLIEGETDVILLES